MAKQKRESAVLEAAPEAEGYAKQILERFAVAASHSQADRGFYSQCVWKIADGTISETEQAAFDLLMAANGDHYDYHGDLDVARKIIDWRNSGNVLANSGEFEERLEEMRQRIEGISKALEASKQNTAKLLIEHGAANASLAKFESRGKQWANMMADRPHLFSEVTL